METTCILGLGYIGLPTALIMAERGCRVVGFDIDEQRVAAINAGDPVIEEPEVNEKLTAVLSSGRFRATTTMETANVYIIAVPTPFTADKRADLSYVWSAASYVASVLAPGNTVILESTVPVGTTKKLAELLEQKSGMIAGVDFFVAHCPERVLPGNIFHELVANARIIGGINLVSVDAAKKTYKAFVQGDLYLTDATTAEMVKLVENSSRDSQIAFAHQVASMAYAAGLDPYKVIELANKHPRVNILTPSCGVGGHCLAVDPWFLVETFPEEAKFLKMARMVNDDKSNEVLGFIEQTAARWHKVHGQQPTVLTLGLTYKPNVNDLRESPALHITEQLLENEGPLKLLTCDPHVENEAAVAGLPMVSLAEGLAQADIVVFLVAHAEFRTINKSLLAHKNILDFCGICHVPEQPSRDNEVSFWPASSAHDFVALKRQLSSGRMPEL